MVPRLRLTARAALSDAYAGLRRTRPFPSTDKSKSKQSETAAAMGCAARYFRPRPDGCRRAIDAASAAHRRRIGGGDSRL
ncbi:hypothetical protein WS72_21650 [Burkholderia savannae]|uniref:Uncharacterized protein n=1 Tax=Burkholderia savannae TaxID=1637837 RepID=A0ABR5T2Y0_9BURK|nr:hypothetical protein WS72_21650 [Burkholderia savannae]